MADWTDRIVGARMAVDREFEDHLRQSEFTRQEWGLVMTAVEFRIEDAEDPDTAELVGDTSNLSAVLPEMERVANMDPMGGGQQKKSGGLLGNIKDSLGLGGGGGGVSDEKAEEAERLVALYADELQAYLVDNGRWPEVCEAASAQDADETAA